MIEEIEPHSDLIEYFNITQRFTSDLTVDTFFDNGEHYNVLSDINQNIFLLKTLDELRLLKMDNHVCDCGIGLGNAIFDIYLQSKEIDKDFTFTGIEKQSSYINFIEENLLHLWNGNLNLIHGDISKQDYSNYNIIYSYSPFNNIMLLKSMYQKITSEVESGSIIIEHANNGKGYFELLDSFDSLQKIDLGWMFVYKKK